MSVQHLLGPPSNDRSNGDNRRSKRGHQEVNDSTYSAKDLVLDGTHVTPDKCTYISVVTTAHSNIPTTSQSDQKLSKNHPGSQDAVIVVRLPAKRLASNPLRVKAANDKSPTIVIPILTAGHQSRHFPLGTAAVTNARPDGTGEQAPSTPPGEMALWSPCLAGSFEGIAAAKPPLVKENTVWLPKCKSPEARGALEPTKDAKKAKERRVDQGPRREWNNLLSTEGDSQTGKTVYSAQVKPTAVTSGPEVLPGLLQSNSSNEVQQDIPLGNVNEDQ